MNLCEIYPKTHEALKKIAVQKRELYLHFLNAAKDFNFDEKLVDCTLFTII